MQRFHDLQVNGAFGVDFNGESLSPEELLFVCESLAAIGVRRFLPTLITDAVSSLQKKLDNLVRCREEVSLAKEMIPGFHVEGPFLSPVRGYIGAHPAQHACSASLDAMKMLYDSGQGLLRLLTLAPEQDPGGKVTRWLVDQGIRVSAGHTDATLDQLWQTIDQGLTGFTHLGNGTPQLMARHDNIIQRALALSESLTIMLIADGHHLPVFVLNNFLRLLGFEKTIVVTDCISAAGLGPGKFQLGDQTVQVTEDLACRSEDGTHFVGSAATMQMMDRILETELQLNQDQRDALLIHNPAKWMGW